MTVERFLGCAESTVLMLEHASEIVPRHLSMCVSQWNRPYIIQAYQCSCKINTADSAQPRNHSVSCHQTHFLVRGRIWARD